MTRPPSVVHLNVVGFPAAVAIARDRSLADKAFVIAGSGTGRAVVLELSPRARAAGLAVGMPLAAARRREAGLLVVDRDERACAAASEAMERVAARYAPLVQNDSGGNLYLDLAGTSRLFGAHVDCAVRIRGEIVEAVGIEPAVAVARNKLVAKVATRSIRPAGIASIREGDEASFLSPQDALLLPGAGPAIARLLSVTSLREIGDIAELADGEALALFGRRGLSLRDAARGLDDSAVEPGGLGERAIRRRLDFAEDQLDAAAIRAALIVLVEDAGLELRRSLLAAGRLELVLGYADGHRSATADGRRSPGSDGARAGLSSDSELIAAADRAFARAATRRVRLRSLGLELGALRPARREPDLFEPEAGARLERLQAAVDASRGRFGPAVLTRAAALHGSHA